MTINYKNISRKQFLNRYFELLNTAQGNPEKKLTPAEIEVLGLFIDLPDKFEHQRFSTAARDKVMKIICKTEDCSRQSLNNKIYSLIRKGFIWRDEDGVLYILPGVLRGAKEGLKAREEVPSSFELTFKFSYDKEGYKGPNKEDQ